MQIPPARYASGSRVFPAPLFQPVLDSLHWRPARQFAMPYALFVSLYAAPCIREIGTGTVSYTHLPLVRMGLALGMKLPQVSGNTGLGDILSTIDIPQILAMVEKGVIGKLVEVESKEGDIVEISVE